MCVCVCVCRFKNKKNALCRSFSDLLVNLSNECLLSQK